MILWIDRDALSGGGLNIHARMEGSASCKTLAKLKLKKLAYTCDDLDAFACNHRGHDLIQEVQS